MIWVVAVTALGLSVVTVSLKLISRGDFTYLSIWLGLLNFSLHNLIIYSCMQHYLSRNSLIQVLINFPKRIQQPPNPFHMDPSTLLKHKINSLMKNLLRRYLLIHNLCLYYSLKQFFQFILIQVFVNKQVLMHYVQKW